MFWSLWKFINYVIFKVRPSINPSNSNSQFTLLKNYPTFFFESIYVKICVYLNKQINNFIIKNVATYADSLNYSHNLFSC